MNNALRIILVVIGITLVVMAGVAVYYLHNLSADICSIHKQETHYVYEWREIPTLHFGDLSKSLIIESLLIGKRKHGKKLEGLISMDGSMLELWYRRKTKLLYLSKNVLSTYDTAQHTDHKFHISNKHNKFIINLLCR